MGWGRDYKITSTNKLPSARSSGPAGDKPI
uniref:Transcriptional regulator n=2 Tax=Onchocerca ochengi TaxID=42157 RepID=A0A182F0H9_ONCOC